MTSLLQINSSIFHNDGQSSQLADQFISAWINNHQETQLVIRDLAKNPLPHLNAERAQAFVTKPDLRSAQQQKLVAESDLLINELKGAEIIVIGLPMYNFGIPSTLKAYIDYIARSGLTFRYTEKGSEGLLTGKKAYIFAARGGLYADTPLDSQTEYMKHFLGFIGITDIEFIYAEGLNISEASKNAALAAAKQQITDLVNQ